MTQLLDRLTAALDERLTQIGREPPSSSDLAMLALETIREPTPEMERAAVERLGNPVYADLPFTVCAWQAMIDCALGVK